MQYSPPPENLGEPGFSATVKGYRNGTLERNGSSSACSSFINLLTNCAKHTQTIRRKQPTDCLSVFDHFKGLVLKKLKVVRNFQKQPPEGVQKKCVLSV